MAKWIGRRQRRTWRVSVREFAEAVGADPLPHEMVTIQDADHPERPPLTGLVLIHVDREVRYDD